MPLLNIPLLNIPPLHIPASEHNAAAHTAAEHTAAEHTASEHTAAAHTAAEHTASAHTAPEHTAAERTAAVAHTNYCNGHKFSSLFTNCLHAVSKSHKIKSNYFPKRYYRGADNSLARPGRKQATATEDFYLHISYL
jgi:hypothetical protein